MSHFISQKWDHQRNLVEGQHQVGEQGWRPAGNKVGGQLGTRLEASLLSSDGKILDSAVCQQDFS